MHLNIESESFEPKHFVIVNFYGRNMCFAWKGNEFVCFPYYYDSSSEKLQVFKAPAKIKTVRSFGQRLFILCYPNGIHKLTENFEFAVLSKSGIELGSDFCEVLSPNNGILVLENKKVKNLKNLFSLSFESDVCALALNFDSTDKVLRKVLLADNYADSVNLCIICHGKNLFKMSDQTVQIIYTSDYLIKLIEPIRKQGKIIGAVLQTNENVVILIHVVEDKLIYEKIFFQTNVKRLYATADIGCENTFFFIHTDGKMTYYTKKVFGDKSNQETRIEENCYRSLYFYKSQFIIYLNDHKELIQVPIGFLKSAYDQSDNDYVRLELNMMKGLDKIIEDICAKSSELKYLREKVVEKEDVLKRINLFVTKKHLKYCPKESVKRILNQTYLVSDFQKVLPENSIIVKMLKNRGKSIFSMKHVKNYNTIVEMPICLPSLSSKLYTTTDLISYKNDGKIWCLIKNFIKDPPPSKHNKVNLSLENKNFVKYKLVVLQNLIQDSNLNIEVLSKLKQDIRQELSFDNEIFQ